MRMGEKIRVLRELRGMGQGELAEAIGLHQVTVSQWERGTRRFDGDYLPAVCEALGIEATVLTSPSPWSRLEEAQDAAKREIDAAMTEVRAILSSARDTSPAPTSDTKRRATHVANTRPMETDDSCSRAPKVLALR